MIKPKSATPSVFKNNALGAVLRMLLLSSGLLRKKLMNIGELAEYQIWLNKRFGKVRIRNSRERVWLDMHESLGIRKIHGVELGVAWGYLTYFWIKNASNSVLMWDGFDLFTGLPREWRSSPAGAFSNGGKTPDIPDPRVNWHVGYVEETIQEMTFPQDRDYSIVVFFDLDIYEPSLVAWEKLKSYLKVGDILYFDEAFDADERKLLDESVLTFGDFKFVSANWISLAIKIEALP